MHTHVQNTHYCVCVFFGQWFSNEAFLWAGVGATGVCVKEPQTESMQKTEEEETQNQENQTIGE